MKKSSIERRALLSGLARALGDTLLPRRCLLCGLPSHSANLCPPCSDELPRCGPVCRYCALPVPAAHELFCGPCIRKPPPWSQAIAGLPYCFPVDQLVCRFKFSADMACGDVLCTELVRQLREVKVEKPNLIVPVPLHRTRQLRRNFNQADLLARGIGRALGIPVNSSLLRRVRGTRRQSGLDAKSRRQNLRGAFFAPGGSKSVSGVARIALVDDVYTTGSTLLECARTLRKVGIREYSVWVAARAPEP